MFVEIRDLIDFVVVVIGVSLGIGVVVV